MIIASRNHENIIYQAITYLSYDIGCIKHVDKIQVTKCPLVLIVA